MVERAGILARQTILEDTGFEGRDGIVSANGYQTALLGGTFPFEMTAPALPPA